MSYNSCSFSFEVGGHEFPTGLAIVAALRAFVLKRKVTFTIHHYEAMFHDGVANYCCKCMIFAIIVVNLLKR